MEEAAELVKDRLTQYDARKAQVDMSLDFDYCGKAAATTTTAAKPQPPRLSSSRRDRRLGRGNPFQR